MTKKTLDEQFVEAAEKVHAQKAVFEKTVKEAMAELAKVCEETGVPVTFNLDGASLDVTYEPKNTKKWYDADDNLRARYDAYGSAYGTKGWHASAIC